MSAASVVCGTVQVGETLMVGRPVAGLLGLGANTAVGPLVSDSALPASSGERPDQALSTVGSLLSFNSAADGLVPP